MALSAAVGLASAPARVRVGDNVRWTAGVGGGGMHGESYRRRQEDAGVISISKDDDDTERV